MKISKKDKIRNENLFQRGGYSVGFIAIVIVAAVVLNLLVSVLSKRVNLEFDLTSEKKNSISQENIEYLQNVEKDVDVYILAASAEDYYGGYMQYYAQQMGYSAETTEYYFQTTALLEKYAEINDHISIKYVDPYGTEMSELQTNYPESYTYGDILVTSSFTAQSGNELKNYKLLNFVDIYNYSDTTGYASYGYDYYYVDGSRLETALTSAIASVTSEETKKVAFLSGHGGSEAFEYYGELLELNNFTVDEISDSIISSVSSDYDAVIICAPTQDFLGSELDILNDFLDNDGYKGKTLMFFGDTAYQNLPNLYDFMGEWGIEIEQGIVFETNKNYRTSDSYSTFLCYSDVNDSGIVSSGKTYITGYNIPMKENGNPYGSRDTTTLLKTLGSSVCAPLGTASSWEPTEDFEKTTYSTAIISEEADFKDNKAVSSYVIAFSSIDFISQEYIVKYANYSDYKGLALNAIRVPTGMNTAEITFENKTISSTTDVYVTSESSAKVVSVLFSIVVPALVLLFGAVVFIRRRAL